MASSERAGSELSREQLERKQRILAGRASGVTESIADAVVAKSENLFFVFQPDGNVPLAGQHGFGLYYNDCRYLSGYELKLGGQDPRVLVSDASKGFMCISQLTNPEIRDGEAGGAPMDEIGITWRRLVDSKDLTLHDSLEFVNYGREGATFPVSLRFECDFRDVFAIRGLWDKQPGTARAPRWEDDHLLFAYDGADGIKRSLTAQFQPHPDSKHGTQVDYQLELGPRERLEIQISFVISERRSEEGAPKAGSGAPNEPRLRDHQEEVSDTWLVDRTKIETDSLLLNSILARSLRDLRLLRNHIDGDEYFAAGVPWYATLFGRDSIITALETLAFNPEMAGQILELLARYQAKEMDPWRDAEPGKILHELRIGELARIGEIPHSPYYGSIDATPLFLILVARHAAWTGSVSLFVSLRDQIEAALEWMVRYGDLDGDGYLEYDSPVGLGLVNQGWKDSGWGIIDEQGNLPKPPIALVEVQGYAYQARMEVADVFEAAGEPDRAKELRQAAQALRAQFNRDFWLEDQGFYALALQAKDDPIRVIASNAGHALWSGVADREKGNKVGERLMQADLFSGWGIRTLSADTSCFNPTAYHLGTVWPHDNAIIAAGLRRYGLDHAAQQIFTGMIEATMHFEDYRLPELFAGFSRKEYDVPVPYPVACHPQAWSAGAVPFLLTTLLGLVPNAFAGQLRVVRPVLPSMVDRIHVRDLRIGQGSVDLSFQRTGQGQCAVNIDGVQGKIDVVLDMEYDA